jgi:hypothetical protein
MHDAALLFLLLIRAMVAMMYKKKRGVLLKQGKAHQVDQTSSSYNETIQAQVA